MTPWPEAKNTKPAAFSEEDMFIVSKADTTIIWTGAKIMYSGQDYNLGFSGMQQASGYNFQSGESDLEPINWLSGTGRIRIPEIGQLHKIFVFPKDPRWVAVAGYKSLTLGTTSGLPSGDGGCSGKMALLKWWNTCNKSGMYYSGCHQLSGLYTSGYLASGFYTFNSGIVDVIAFGSIY